MKVKLPMVSLGDVLVPAGEAHRVEPDRSYPNIGIYGFGRGVFEKPAISGSSTSATTLFRVRANQFIYSRLFAFEGAYAMVPVEFDGVFVSNEFPAFECRGDRVLPGFIGWYFSQPRVWSRLAEGGKGMGDRRKRIHPERILEHRIHLPQIDIQRQLIVRLDGTSARIRAIRSLQAELDLLLPALVEETFREVNE